jgi:aconitate hydratase
VEFFGKGLASMTVPDRATIANMSPEYGATIGFFPVDDETLRYYRLTGRDEKHVKFIGEYSLAQGVVVTADAPVRGYSEVVELDLSTVEPSVAGPKRPQDRVPVGSLHQSFESLLAKNVSEGGFGVEASELYGVLRQYVAHQDYWGRMKRNCLAHTPVENLSGH